MNMYVDSFDDDELEIVLDESEGIEVVLDSAAITWSEINGEITKNKSVVEFLNNLPMLPDIPTEEVEHILKANAGEATWQIDNKATQEELLNGLSEVNQIIVDGLATKQDVGDYATREELNTASQTLQESINTASQTLQENINTKQDAGNYATREELTTASQTLQENINTKQDVGDYATREELTTASQTLQENINTKQDVGDYATKTQLTEGLNTKQDVGDYITKTLYDQTNEAFQNALNGKQATGDYVTNTELENKKYLTSFTEKDPVYLADKPNLALKSELPDLTPYATKEELTNGLSGKQETGDYALKSEIPSLADYVKNTDYATASKGGVVKQSSTYGSGIANGFLYAAPKTLEGYTSASDNIFIGKGTLENIKDDYIKRGLTDNQVELTEEELAKIKAYLKFADNTDILTAIASIPQFKFSIVSNLPETGEKMTLYLVPKTGADNDVHNEYVWIEEESKYEYIGTTAVDLTDYVKNTDYASGTTAGVVRSGSYYGTQTIGGFLAGNPRTLEQYKEAINQIFIAKGTLTHILPPSFSISIASDVCEIDPLIT